ncbi:MAG: right-handed parallel beta-helix repeat-containing protein [Chloroflexota bacterium]
MSINKRFILSLVVFISLIFQLMAAVPARADEGTPTEPAPTEEPVEPPLEGEQPAEPLLSQVPEGTAVIVVNETGEVEPLATQAAAAIIANSDPMWCPAGETPLTGTGCTPAEPTFTALVTTLTGGSYTGDGTIFFQDGTYGGAETSILLDSTVLNSLGALTLQGGWDLATPLDLGGTTTFNVPLVIFWNNNVFLNDINVDLTGYTGPASPGIAVVTDGDISLDTVTAIDNPTETGADLNNCLPDPVTGVCTAIAGGNISVDDSNFSDNYGYGLYAETGGNIDLDNVQATGNQQDGADLIADGDVTVTSSDLLTDSNFSGNGDTGLNIISAGAVTLDGVIADTNNSGVIVENHYGTGAVTITDSSFNDNAWTGLYVKSAGDITLTNVIAGEGGTPTRGNDIGAYLYATGSGNIFVTNSSFEYNSSIGLKAVSSQGNITADTIIASNNGSFGAWLKAYSGGTVDVIDSIFDANLSHGLFVVGTNDVLLDNVTATNNAGDGARVLSGWTFGCFGPTGIGITILDGSYQNNTGFGIYAGPGPVGGTLTLQGTINFLANTNGDYYLDLTDSCIPCQETEKPPAKPYNQVEVPDKGGTPVEQDCETYSGTLMVLPNGDKVKFVCPGSGLFLIEHLTQEELPGPLATGPRFVAAIKVSLEKDGEPVKVLEEGGYFQVTFDIPEELVRGSYSILYWDETARNGQGDWVELPRDQFGGENFPLHPDTPEDNMLILRGVRVQDDNVSVKVNFTGTFVLVVR